MASLSGLSSSDSGLNWTATFTPDAGVTDTSNVITLLAGGVKNSAGNVGSGTVSSPNYTIDTVRPQGTITLSDSALKVGETATVTITFNKPVTGLTLADFTVENGTLTGLSSADGITWSAILTPAADVRDSSNVITLDNSRVTDASGNAGTGTAQSANFTVDTVDSTIVDGVEVRTTTSVGTDGLLHHTITIPIVSNTRIDSAGSPNVADIPLVTGADGSLVLGVGVPTGIGLQVSGTVAATSAHNAANGLTAAIEARSQAGSADQGALVAGGSNFVASLDPGSPLLVQTVVVTAGSDAGASNHPLEIRGGAPAPGATNTALVIDTRALSGDATILLDNVEFAVLVGSMRVTGTGTSSQTVWGDSSSQTIVLGADDDEVHGGAGDDTIGGGGGNDRLFGDAGDDTLFGGAGQDLILGGTGNDTVLYEGNQADYTIERNGKIVTVRSLVDATDADTLVNVESIRFADGTLALTDASAPASTAKLIAGLYAAIFERAPDTDGLQYWVGKASAGQASLREIATLFAAMAKFDELYAPSLADAGFVDAGS